MKRAPKLTARSGAKSGAKPGAEAAKKTPKRAPKKLSAPKAKAVPIPDFRDSVEHAVHGVMIHRNFRPLYANAAFARLFGCKTAGELLAMPLIRPLIPPDNWARMETHHDAVMRDGRGGDLRRERMLTQGGQEIWVALTERKIKWQGGSAVEWHAFDITGQMHGEQELLATEQRLRAILEVLPYPIIIAQHPGGQILFVNRKTCLLLSQSAGGLLKSRTFDFFVNDEDRVHFLTLLNAIQELREMEVKLKAHDGRQFLAELAAIAIDYGGQNAVLLAFTDISARKQLETALFHEASTDALTGVSNRRYFIARAEQELRRARRFARGLSVMMVDLDHFKNINDTHGHAGGDLVLKEAVKACSGSLRGTDNIGRLGGEEFAVLMPETDLKAALEGAERLRRAIEGHKIAIGKQIVQCTASVGVASLQPQDGDIDALLHRADQALYLAKQDGRNRVVGAE